jgi:16S rRNA (guanine966-N2)-methyltransferase
MTRIVGGEFGGRVLEVPANGTRPTSDRVREAIFSKLMHDDVLENAQVVDLFAGSGALGLEAISRGAKSALLVEANKKANAVAQRNVDGLGVSSQVRVVTDDVKRYTAAMSRAGGIGATNLRIAFPSVEEVPDRLETTEMRGLPKRAITLVFLDPPYDYSQEDLASVLANLMRTGLLVKGAIIVVERGTRTPPPHWPDGMELTSTKTYGETVVYYAEVTEGVEL